jgi:hypothetical protein
VTRPVASTWVLCGASGAAVAGVKKAAAATTAAARVIFVIICEPLPVCFRFLPRANALDGSIEAQQP